MVWFGLVLQTVFTLMGSHVVGAHAGQRWCGLLWFGASGFATLTFRLNEGRLICEIAQKSAVPQTFFFFPSPPPQLCLPPHYLTVLPHCATDCESLGLLDLLRLF